MDPYYSEPEVVCFDNDNDAFVPELWVYEGLKQLEENMVIANLVHRDFEDAVAAYGDVVNTRRPGEFKIRRKNDQTTSLDKQDAKATNVPVKLNQWFYNSFVIKDGEQSYAFRDLVDIYLIPSMRTIARSVDRAVLGHFHKFLGTPSQRVGRLRNLVPTTSHDVVLEAREVLNRNNAPLDESRHLVLSPMSETALLKNDLFLKANERGDGGNALANATLGRILGFGTYMGQNVPYADLLSTDAVAGTVTNAVAAGEQMTNGQASGAVSVTGYEVSAGEYAVVDGNDQPTVVAAATAAIDTTSLGLTEANKYATQAGATIRVYKKCAAAAGYAAGHIGKITLDGFTAGKAPAVGQLIAFGTGGSRHVYTIIESEDAGGGVQELWLDRPLDAAVADNDDAFPGPAGAYNLAFHREALALVTRPLAVPSNRMGVMSGVAAYNDIAMRVSMQYDIDAGGTVVNCDILAGVAVLDDRLAVVTLG